MPIDASRWRELRPDRLQLGDGLLVQLAQRDARARHPSSTPDYSTPDDERVQRLAAVVDLDLDVWVRGRPTCARTRRDFVGVWRRRRRAP